MGEKSKLIIENKINIETVCDKYVQAFKNVLAL